MTTATGRTAPGVRGGLSLGGFDESGWSGHSKRDLAQVNAKLGHRGALGWFSLCLLHGQSTLIGNGLVPWVSLEKDGQGTADLRALRRSAVYTHPTRPANA